MRTRIYQGYGEQEPSLPAGETAAIVSLTGSPYATRDEAQAILDRVQVLAREGGDLYLTETGIMETADGFIPVAIGISEPDVIEHVPFMLEDPPMTVNLVGTIKLGQDLVPQVMSKTQETPAWKYGLAAVGGAVVSGILVGAIVGARK